MRRFGPDPANLIGYALGSFFVVRENMMADLDMFERTLEDARKLPSGLVDSYRSRDAAPYRLGRNLAIEQNDVLRPQEVSGETLGTGGSRWADFEVRHPGASGFVIFSRVGF